MLAPAKYMKFISFATGQSLVARGAMKYGTIRLDY